MVVLGGCVETPTESRRWPDHRKQHDSQLAELHSKIKEQEQQLHTLGERVEKLEAALKAAATTPAANAGE